MLEDEPESSSPKKVESLEVDTLEAVVVAADEVWVPGCDVRATAANAASAAAALMPIA